MFCLICKYEKQEVTGMYIEQLNNDTAKAIAANITDTGMVCGYVGIDTDSQTAHEIKKHKYFAANNFGIRGTGGITFSGQSEEMQMEYAEKTGDSSSLVWVGFDRYAQEDEIRYNPCVPESEQFSAEQAAEILELRWKNAEKVAESIYDVIDTARVLSQKIETKERELMAEKSR